MELGFDPDYLTASALAYLKKAAGNHVRFRAVRGFVQSTLALDLDSETDEEEVWAIDETAVGQTAAHKYAFFKDKLEPLGVDALLIQKLDEVAYLTNLRGNAFPYQSTFRSMALLTPESLLVSTNKNAIPAPIQEARRPISFVGTEAIWSHVAAELRGKSVGFDPSLNSEGARLRIVESGARPVEVKSPIATFKAKKTPAEIKVMQDAFTRADRVVWQSMQWLCDQVVSKKEVSEYDFSQKVESLFKDAGATGLSFKVIAAAGKNAAIIHYSDPKTNRIIQRGELMLLDTGAYFKEGYATDLTRTFLVDAPEGIASPEKRHLYTLVLKGAIEGMRAILPVGARGGQLDSLIRAPLWREGLDYRHGSGHGVGINVHEFPPRIGPHSQSVLEEGQIFSIEPGYYAPGLGGVRIENLCTLVLSRPGYLAVQPLTHCPLDDRLIDLDLLSPSQAHWLSQYQKKAGRLIQ